MKYDITYKCGHTGTVEINGTNVHGERDSKIKWYESNLCPECYAEWLREQNERLSAGYPELTGSEKQIAWATKIRADFIRQYADVIEIARSRMDDLKKAMDAGNKKSALIYNIMTNNTAKWFIDNRI